MVANQEGIWDMGQILVDNMTVEILCTALCDFRAKSVGAVSINVFCKNGPDGGAMGQMHVDDMTVEILCTALGKICRSSVQKCVSWCGARRGPCDK